MLTSRHGDVQMEELRSGGVSMVRTGTSAEGKKQGKASAGTFLEGSPGHSAHIKFFKKRLESASTSSIS